MILEDNILNDKMTDETNAVNEKCEREDDFMTEETPEDVEKNSIDEQKCSSVEDKVVEEKVESGKFKFMKGDSKKESQKVKIEELKEQLAVLNDKYLRLVAEFDNYRRRTAKERLELICTASEDVIKGFLPVLDDCERALQLLEDADVSDAAKEGTELIYSKLLSYLKSKGVSSMDAKGKEFDTDYHEAIAQFPAEDKKLKNKVIDVAQQGYTLNGKVIRFAKVVIGI
ncbi:MAG: nucleotide exchange factor GrpE [Bacteroidales bacterium]|nr:nucleotide exchange factor GrpE [Bacteroidales bacterium]